MQHISLTRLLPSAKVGTLEFGRAYTDIHFIKRHIWRLELMMLSNLYKLEPSLSFGISRPYCTPRINLHAYWIKRNTLSRPTELDSI